jgi:glycosyltransferase involved in cell wall biosynthesis
MPLLEGMAAGLPVACSDIEPLRTLAAGAALGFDPLSTQAIAEAILRITEDDAIRERLSTIGPMQASLFNWEHAARSTITVLEEAATRKA